MTRWYSEPSWDWRLQVLEARGAQATTAYAPLASETEANAVFVADCRGDRLVTEIFARELADGATPPTAFAELNRCLLGGGLVERTSRAFYASFLTGGLIRVWWAGYCGIHIRRRDGEIVVKRCPAAGLGRVAGVSGREVLIALARGEAMLVQNGPLEHLFRVGAVSRREIFARASLDGVDYGGSAGGVPSALTIRRLPSSDVANEGTAILAARAVQCAS